jgi:hypothetical protein
MLPVTGRSWIRCLSLRCFSADTPPGMCAPIGTLRGMRARLGTVRAVYARVRVGIVRGMCTSQGTPLRGMSVPSLALAAESVP